MPALPPEPKSYLAGIQWLRGLAALMVVTFHVVPQLERMGYTGTRFRGLASGVDIFFVISGFIMWHITSSQKRADYRTFARRRVERIVPLYWIITSFVVFMMLTIPSALQTSRFDLMHVVCSYLFIPAHHPKTGGYFPVVDPGWTLNYEMAFYALFCIALAVAPTRKWVRFACVSVPIILSCCAGCFLHLNGLVSFYTNPIMLEFVAGICVATVYNRFRRIRSGFWWVGLFISVLALVLTPPLELGRGLLNPLMRTCFATLTILSTAIMPEKQNHLLGRVATQIGDSSYSLYLSHFIVMSAIGQLWRKLPWERHLSIILFPPLAVTIAVMFGYAVYRFVERPSSGLLRRLLERTSPSSSLRQELLHDGVKGEAPHEQATRAVA